MSSINRNFFITRAETVTVMIANSLRLPSFRWSQDLPNQVPAHAFTIWHCVCRDCCGAWKGWKWWILLRCGSTFLSLVVDGTYLHFHTQLCVAKTFTRRELCFCLPTQNATNILLPPQDFNEEKKWVNDFPTGDYSKKGLCHFPSLPRSFSSCWNPWFSKEEWILSPYSREKWVWRHFL